MIAAMTVTIHLPGARTLKEKRMTAQSLRDILRRRFNITIAETAEHDTHSRLILTIAGIVTGPAMADSLMDSILNLIASRIDGEIISADRELL